MAPTVNSYLDSISNPTGHFTALEGIFPCRDRHGGVIFARQTHTVNFTVEWRGVRHQLKCFLTGSAEVKNRARLIASQLASLHGPYAPEYLYLEAEMAVTDSAGNSSLQDVVLQRTGEGKSLHRFLLDACDRGDAACVGALLREVAALSRWLSDNRLAHRNIKPSNLLIRATGEPLLLNYDFAEKVPPASGGAPDPLDADNRSLAGLGLALFLLACDPRLYRLLRQEEIFAPANAASLAASLRAGTPCKPLYDLASALAGGELPDRRTLDAMLDALARTPASSVALPADIAKAYDLPAEPCERAVRRKPDLSGYLAVEQTSEMLTPVQDRDGKWLYVDASGHPICGERYDEAGDFAEGRAVVRIGDRCTLIDRQGRRILPLIFENVEWDACAGIATVESDGKSGLFDRSGAQLTDVTYDWISEFCNGLILARQDERHGYLDRRGRVAIAFDYDTASSFSADGTAPVSVGGEEFRIDKSGRRIPGPGAAGQPPRRASKKRSLPGGTV